MIRAREHERRGERFKDLSCCMEKSNTLHSDRRTDGNMREGADMGPSEKGKTSSGLKSALDIALERLGAGGTFDRKLSEEQKKALAEVERQAQAKVAEVEILMAQRIGAARARGDEEEAMKLEEEKRREIARIRERAESDRERIRRGSAS